MFDVSFSELMLIGIIALIVIGPQRLPKVARTIGHLVGRAQRYVSDVKTDIQREIDLDELNKVKSQMESAAKSVRSSVNDLGSSLSQPVDDARQALTDASNAFHASMQPPAKTDTPAEPGDAGAQPPATSLPDATAAAPAATPDVHTPAAQQQPTLPGVDAPPASPAAPVVPDAAPATPAAAPSGPLDPAPTSDTQHKDKGTPT